MNNYRRVKDRRQPYYGSKRFDRSCRNHGDCPWCRSARLYNSTLRQHYADLEIAEYYGRKVRCIPHA